MRHDKPSRNTTRKTAAKPKRAGQVRPFTPDHIATLETILRNDGSHTALRDHAMLRVGIDTLLRTSDMTQLTLADVCHSGEIRDEIEVRQKKTGRSVKCVISDRTKPVLAAWIAANPQFDPHSRLFAITPRQHQRIVKHWCGLLHLDGALYSTHSIRRTLPSHIFKQTGNIVAAQHLLGHSSVAATSLYLGVTGDDARAVARKYSI